MVGSHLADYLLKNTNWKIVGLVRWQDDLKNIRHLINQINQNDRISLFYGDLNDSLSIEKLIKETLPNYVFHLAAESYPLTSFDSPLNTYQVNILGTERILYFINKYSRKSIVHVCSSSEVFGRVDKSKLPINENCNFHPASPYAISKVGTDLIARYYAEAYGLKVMSTRMFTHTGPRRGDVFAESSFAKQIAMIENNLIPPIVHVGNLKSLRTWADVRDAVRAYHMLVTINPKRGEIYNIGGSYSCTIKDMLDVLLGLSNKANKIKIKVDKKRIRPIDADAQIPDTSKFENHTGWKPKIKFKKTMKDLLDYWRAEVKKNRYFLKR